MIIVKRLEKKWGNIRSSSEYSSHHLHPGWLLPLVILPNLRVEILGWWKETEQLFFGYMRAYEWLVLLAPCACEVPHLILAAQ